MKATTPCPPWCRTDHEQFRSHGQIVHVVDDVRVHAFQYDDKTPNVSVVTGPPGREIVFELALTQASAFASIVDALGHPNLGEAIRQAAALILDAPTVTS